MTLNSPQGIDQLRRHGTLGFWAIIEAKGGTSSLGTADYGKEMGANWIRHWLNDTVARNPTNLERNSLLAAMNPITPIPMLAAIVRVNVERKTWSMKITAQKFDWNDSEMAFAWPRGT